VTADLGAFLMDGTVETPMSVRRMLPGCYRWEAYQVEVLGRFTTATPTDAYRGAGRPEALFGIERAMDDLAAELGMNPAELRRHNMPSPDQFPFPSIGGYTYDSAPAHLGGTAVGPPTAGGVRCDVILGNEQARLGTSSAPDVARTSDPRPIDGACSTITTPGQWVAARARRRGRPHPGRGSTAAGPRWWAACAASRASSRWRCSSR
jgi:hypothetical protein